MIEGLRTSSSRDGDSSRLELRSSAGAWAWRGTPEPPIFVAAGANGSIAAIETALRGRGEGEGSPGGGWAMALGYSLGRSIEPSAGVCARRVDEAWPWDAVLWRCPAGARGSRVVATDAGKNVDGFALGAWRSSDRSGFERAVRRGVDYIHAGDVFQVNLAHRLRAPFAGSTRGLAAELFSQARPALGAYLELDHNGRRHAAISVSPELFLAYDARTRRVMTRPIKGTRPISPSGVEDRELLASGKDQAELAMIVDLMRNDLGRVCEYGTVRVAEPRAIERHERSGVVHTVATIEGRLREGLGAIDLLKATFPCGSVTGAPKVRAMQIIDELESEPRGLYTGAIGWIDDEGSMTLSVAIRTAVIVGTPGPRGPDEVLEGELVYGVGAGIVAESTPEREWLETLDKARVMQGVIGGGHASERRDSVSSARASAAESAA